MFVVLLSVCVAGVLAAKNVTDRKSIATCACVPWVCECVFCGRVCVWTCVLCVRRACAGRRNGLLTTSALAAFKRLDSQAESSVTNLASYLAKIETYKAKIAEKTLKADCIWSDAYTSTADSEEVYHLCTLDFRACQGAHINEVCVCS